MGQVTGRRWHWTVSVAAVLGFLLVWHLVALRSTTGLIPSPIQVGEAFVELATSGRLANDIQISLQRVLLGWLLGSALAIPLGIWAGTSKIARAILDPFIHFFRFVPALALVSLFILWFGIGEWSKINLVVYAATFVVLVTTATGAAGVNPDKLHAARSLGADRRDLFLRVTLPATIPPIHTGMRLALANSFLVIVAAEALATQEGIGFLIWNARTYFRTDFIFVGVICFGALGFLFDRAWRLLGNTLLKRFLTTVGDY